MKTLARAIRSITPFRLRRTLWRIGDYFGIDLELPERFPSLIATFATLRRLGLNLGFCVDVGAYHGEWTRWFKTQFPAAKLLMIEAQESQRAHLESIRALYPHDVNVEICLLGPRDGDAVIFNEMETGSSVFAEASHYERNAVPKLTRSLDCVLAEGNFPPVDFLKLDVQGYELEVLKGASETLRQTTAVLLEVSLVPVNAGCPLIAEVMAFMTAHGFRLFDFCGQTRRRDGVLWQTDLLFLREGCALQPNANLTPENWG